MVGPGSGAVGARGVGAEKGGGSGAGTEQGSKGRDAEAGGTGRGCGAGMGRGKSWRRWRQYTRTDGLIYWYYLVQERASWDKPHELMSAKEQQCVLPRPLSRPLVPLC